MAAIAPDYPVLELRRAALVSGAVPQVARYLDDWGSDPEDGPDSIVFGQFFERDHADRLTWLRGYRDLDTHALQTRAPRRQTREDLLQPFILGSDSLLLRALHPGAQPPALAPVDPALEPAGAQGLAVAQLLNVAPGRLPACARAADPWFARYTGHGMIEAGILGSLDDAGPGWLVWLGVVRDDAALASLRPQCDACAGALGAAGLLAAPAELLVLAPAPASRLRWGPRTIS